MRGQGGLCSWEARGVTMEEERKQQPGRRSWLISPCSCLVSSSSWAEGWLGVTTGVLLCVLWVRLGEKLCGGGTRLS